MGTCHDTSDIECLWDGDCQTGVCLHNKCDAGNQTISYRPNNNLCLRADGKHGVYLQQCNPSDRGMPWIFNSGEYQNYMQIQRAIDTNLCLDAGDMAPGAKLKVEQCNGAQHRLGLARSTRVPSTFLMDRSKQICVLTLDQVRQ